MFPSPYRGYHLSTFMKAFKEKFGNGFRPLIGVIIFQQKYLYEEVSRVQFPSPYRGYHLSTLGLVLLSLVVLCFRPLIGVIIFQLAIDEYTLNDIPYKVSVPLSGLSSFN